MQVLEKILQEIEEAQKEPLFRLCDYSYKERQNRIINRITEIIRSHMDNDGWIPAVHPPKDNNYILLSFSNYSILEIGRYEEGEHGDSAYYLRDYGGEATCINQGLHVNAWMPLPEPYKELDDDE